MFITSAETHLKTQRPAVKDHDSTEYFRFRPVAYHVGNTIGVLFIEMMHCIRESTGRLLQTGLSQLNNHSVPPGFIQSMFVYAVIQLKDDNSELVTRSCQYFYETQDMLLCSWARILEVSEQLCGYGVSPFVFAWLGMAFARLKEQICTTNLFVQNFPS